MYIIWNWQIYQILTQKKYMKVEFILFRYVWTNEKIRGFHLIEKFSSKHEWLEQYPWNATRIHNDLGTDYGTYLLNPVIDL